LGRYSHTSVTGAIGGVVVPSHRFGFPAVVELRRHLGPRRHRRRDRVLLGHEGQMRGSRTGRLQVLAEELEELDVVLPRHLVHAELHLLGQPGEELQQRHARIAVVVVRPLLRVARNAQTEVVHDLLEGAVVDFRLFAGHQRTPSSR